jgi:hypothetical protein
MFAVGRVLDREEEIEYGQQKNREYIWQQAKQERWEYKRLKSFGKPPCLWNELDEDMVCVRYEILCKNANITPW